MIDQPPAFPAIHPKTGRDEPLASPRQLGATGDGAYFPPWTSYVCFNVDFQGGFEGIRNGSRDEADADADVSSESWKCVRAASDVQFCRVLDVDGC